MVWLTASVLIFSISIGWYVSQPVVIGVARGVNSTITNQQGRNVATFVEYASFLWGPIVILFILLWAVISSQRRDVESEIYG